MDDLESLAIDLVIILLTGMEFLGATAVVVDVDCIFSLKSCFCLLNSKTWIINLFKLFL